MEAIILAGGKAERLGEATGGRPKALVHVGGRALADHQIGQLARAGVGRVIVSCAEGQAEWFEEELSGRGPEIVTAAEQERLGRGGAIRFATGFRNESGPLYVLNGDELIDVDLAGLLARHRERRPAATITVAHPRSPFGVVDIDQDDVVNGFDEAAMVPIWVSCGVYVLDEEALERMPERGDHETTAFPELVSEGKLHAFRHEGTWLTVNTPKDLRRAEEFVRAHPDWLQ